MIYQSFVTETPPPILEDRTTCKIPLNADPLPRSALILVCQVSMRRGDMSVRQMVEHKRWRPPPLLIQGNVTPHEIRPHHSRLSPLRLLVVAWTLIIWWMWYRQYHPSGHLIPETSGPKDLTLCQLRLTRHLRDPDPLGVIARLLSRRKRPERQEIPMSQRRR